MNLVGTVFAPQFPAAQLHWILADAHACITIECVRDGLKIYDNPAGVLTNNPPFEQQMFLLNQYMNLSPSQPENHFSQQLPLQTYSRGMGALGLPGDLSSTSRFAKVALPEHMQYREIPRRKVSASFSTFWDRWISREDVVKWLRANTRSQFIPPAGMHRRESTIIILMRTIRSLRSTCIVRIWTEPH